MQQIALLGLGVMGAGMAGQILKAGFSLVIYNRSQERGAALQKQGAQLASTPREAAKNADVILTMVADDNASRQVWLGENGALSGAKAGAVALDCGTLSPGWIRELAREANNRGCEFLDAPVTGSKTQAESGELLFLVGGEAATLERVRPVLKAMSRDIVHLGPSGSGAIMKLMNNYLCTVQNASLAEAVAAIEKCGLDRAQALEILRNGAPGSPLVRAASGRMESGDYSVNFTLQLMRKDLHYATAEAAAHGVSFETGKGALKLLDQACEQGHGLKDFSAIVEVLR